MLDNPEALSREILKIFDRDMTNGEFPHFGTDTHWAFAKARLSAFRSADEWLTIFEMLVYYNGLCDIEILVLAFGNQLRKTGFQDPMPSMAIHNSSLASRLMDRIWMTQSKKSLRARQSEWYERLNQYGLKVPNQEEDWCPDPMDFEVRLNGTLQHFALTCNDYTRAGIDLDAPLSGDHFLDRIIHVVRVLASVVPADQLFYPTNILLEYVGRPATLPLVLRLEEWCNPGIGGIAKPSDSPCLRSLAKALAYDRPDLYECSSELVNTHWSRWPQFVY